MEPSILSLLPPVVAIGLAILTRRILLSLGIGIVLGALMYSQWDILASVSLVAEVAGGLIIAEGAIAEEMYILAFVVMLGILTSFIYISGGLLAFSDWAVTKVRTRFQAQLVPYILGLVIFFDDAFSCLVGGNVSRTITDKYRISSEALLHRGLDGCPCDHPDADLRVGRLHRRHHDRDPQQKRSHRFFRLRSVLGVDPHELLRDHRHPICTLCCIFRAQLRSDAQA
jgi:hypothetical protein